MIDSLLFLVATVTMVGCDTTEAKPAMFDRIADRIGLPVDIKGNLMDIFRFG